MKFILFIMLFCCFSLYGSEYKFYYNGEKIETEVLSINGTKDRIEKGDIINIFNKKVVVDDARTYYFETDEKNENILYVKKDDSPRYIVWIKIPYDYSQYEKDNAKKKKYENPLLKMNHSEISRLRGIQIEYWNKDINNKLKYTTKDKVFFELNDSNLFEFDSTDNRLHDIFKDAVYLKIQNSSSDGINSFENFTEFTKLQYLSIQLRIKDEFNIKHLRNCKELKYLSIYSRKFENIEYLSSLHNIRSLQIYSFDPYDFSHHRGRNYGNEKQSDDQRKYIENALYVKDMPYLKDLNIVGSKVKDLSVISEHTAIESISAQMSHLKILPMKKISTLKHINILSTPISQEDAQKFEKLNPQCTVIYLWKKLLISAIGQCDRLEVYQYGSKGKNILFTEKGNKKVKEFIERVEINESSSGAHCMCNGNPQFAFYQKDIFKEHLSFHHGTGLRWNRGWPGDAALTIKSGKQFGKWLADNNVKVDLAAHLKMTDEQLDSAKKRQQEYMSLVPEAVMKKMSTCRSSEDAAYVFEDVIKDEVERAKVYLRLFGFSKSSWNAYDQMEHMILDYGLPNISDNALTKASEQLANDKYGSNGVCKWLFGSDQWKKVDRHVLDKILEQICKTGMSSALISNREETITSLKEIGGDTAIGILRKILRSEFTDHKEDVKHIPGYVQSYGEMNKVSDEARAASALAVLKDTQSVAYIEKMIEKATEKNKKIYENAVAVLHGEKQVKKKKDDDPLGVGRVNRNPRIRELQSDCYSGNYSAVKQYIDRGYDVNVRMLNDQTPLMQCCEQGHDNLVKLLLKAGADTSLIDGDDDTALLKSINNKHYSTIELLLKNGANPEIETKVGTALNYAYLKRDYKAAELLIRNGADAGYSFQGMSLFTRSCLLQKSALVKAMFESGFDINKKDDEGISFFAKFCSIPNMNKQIIDMVWNSEININSVDIWGATPLMSAISSGDIATIKKLLKNGAYVNARNFFGITPLGLLFKGKYPELEKILRSYGGVADFSNIKPTHLVHYIQRNDMENVKKKIAQGIDVNYKDVQGRTPLMWAAYYGSKEMMEYLIEQGAHVNDKDNRVKLTPLFWALRKNNTENAEILIKHGADINVEDVFGDEVIFCAFEKERCNKLKLLIKNNVKLNVFDRADRSPLFIAIIISNLEATKLLLDNGIDVNCGNKAGNLIPLSVAGRTKNKDIIKLLLKYNPDLEKRDRNNWTVYESAEKEKLTELLELLPKKEN